MYIVMYQYERGGYPYIAYSVPDGQLLIWSEERDAETWARRTLHRGMIWRVKHLPDLWDA